jgi:DNA-binding NarL/FixJ family response regulator
VLLRQGMSNKMIASQLGITEGTVKNYMSDIFKALNVSNRTQAARFDSDSA